MLVRKEDFARLRAGDAGCPSDLMLDRLAVEELRGAAAEPVRAHLTTCAACTARMAQRSFAAFPQVDERVMLAAIRRGVDEPRTWRERAGRWLLGLGAARAPLALAAGLGALLLLLRPPTPLGGDLGGPGDAQPRSPGDPDSVRQKGGLMLRVYRQVGEGSEEVLSGGRFARGDVLRFVVDLPSEGHIGVLGVEQGGALYTAWPRPSQKESTRRPLGAGQRLPGAVSLDSSTGQETLYLVHCTVVAGPPACRAAQGGAPPLCQPGCALSPFVVNKAR